MKKLFIVLMVALLAIVVVSTLGATTLPETSHDDNFSSGKWVAEYFGQSTPVRCVCISAALNAKCRVGDSTSNTSLCDK